MIKHLNIEGVITDKDSKTNYPLPFANVMLYQGEKWIAEITTDIDGNYKLTLKDIDISVEYLLKATFLGYDTSSIAVNFSGHSNKESIPNLIFNFMLISPPNPGCYGSSYYLGLFSLDPIPSGKTFYKDDLKHSPY